MAMSWEQLTLLTREHKKLRAEAALIAAVGAQGSAENWKELIHTLRQTINAEN